MKSKQLYPSWRYHRVLPAVIVHTPQEDADLGPEWAATPAVFTELPDEGPPPKKPRK